MIVLGIETSCDETAAAVVDAAPNPSVYPFGAVLLSIDGVGDPWLFSFFTERASAIETINAALDAAIDPVRRSAMRAKHAETRERKKTRDQSKDAFDGSECAAEFDKENVGPRNGATKTAAEIISESVLEAAATEQAHAGAALFLFDLLVDGCRGCGLAAADAYVAEEWLDRARTLGHAEATAPTRSAKIEAARKMQGKAKMNWFGKWMEKKRRNRKERTEYESNMRTFWFGILLFLIWNFPNPCLAPPKKGQGERSSSGGDGGAPSKKKDRRKSKAHKRHEKTNKKKKKL